MLLKMELLRSREGAAELRAVQQALSAAAGPSG